MRQIRHPNVQLLQVQLGKLRRRGTGDTGYIKIIGKRNPADLFAKGTEEGIMDKHFKIIGCWLEGRLGQSICNINQFERQCVFGKGVELGGAVSVGAHYWVSLHCV